jgi:hypothetical protein
VYEARKEEMRNVLKTYLEKSQGKCSGRTWNMWDVNIKMLLNNILHHEVSYTYKTECGSSLLQTDDRKYDYGTWALALKEETFSREIFGSKRDEVNSDAYYRAKNLKIHSSRTTDGVVKSLT